MKNFTSILIAILLLASCTKTDVTIPQPNEIVVESSAMADFNAGKTVKFFNVDLATTLIASITEGQNQTWDYSTLNIKDTTAINYLAPVVNDSFSSATYMTAVTEIYGVGSASSVSNSKYYGELSTSGFASLGKSIQQVNINLGVGSIVLPVQSIRSSDKVYSANFPMHFADSSAKSGIIEIYKMVVTAPPLVSPNSPGYEESITAYKNRVVASGQLKLKGYSNTLPVLVLKNSTATKISYFINGAPAPAALLSYAGVTNGAITNSYSYSFYSPSIGFVGGIYMDSTNTTVLGASFRRNF